MRQSRDQVASRQLSLRVSEVFRVQRRMRIRQARQVIGADYGRAFREEMIPEQKCVERSKRQSLLNNRALRVRGRSWRRRDFGRNETRARKENGERDSAVQHQ